MLLILGTGVAHDRMPGEVPPERGDESALPRPEVARIASLGHRGLVADYYWLRAVQRVGALQQDPSREATRIGRLIELVTRLDPWVDHPYRFAAVWMIDREENVRAANRLLWRGIAYHPREWRNRFYLGFNHFFYLEGNARAADVLEAATTLPGAPRYLRRLVARLRAQTDGLETAAAFLQELTRNAPDGYARAEYEKALDEIETERRARFLDAARAEYRRRHGRDIEAVEDLLRGPDPVLRRLPEELHGWEWVLDDESGEIVSSYYGNRYKLHIHPLDRKRRERWREQAERGTS